ncbi:sigma-54 interaction domain-containing protein [Gemmatimonas groenlandica]|nr:sigma-54 dependent transcriptional regulator [Gemmatimonas groenlandica]
MTVAVASQHVDVVLPAREFVDAPGRQQPEAFHGMYATSPVMRRCFSTVRRAGSNDITVLVTGESGTGKELVARALHEESARAKKPFIAINCSALPEQLVESELFGHVRGAFTGAVKDHTGYFEAAHGGTLFLDEIGDLSQAAQAKVLRALESGEISPVGGTRRIHVNVRVIAATNRPLEQMVAQQRFREDLMYRLKVVPLELPALRERVEDIAMLADLFLGRFSARHRLAPRTLSPEALAMVLAHRWPGNVRELRNAMEHALVMADGAFITPYDLPDGVRAGARGHSEPDNVGRTSSSAGRATVGRVMYPERRKMAAAV